MAGRQALRLPSPTGIGGHHAIAARIPALAEVAKQAHRGVAARIPALEEIRFIGIEQTVPEVAAPAAPGTCRGPEIALHRAQTQPDLLRNRWGGPALVV